MRGCKEREEIEGRKCGMREAGGSGKEIYAVCILRIWNLPDVMSASKNVRHKGVWLKNRNAQHSKSSRMLRAVVDFCPFLSSFGRISTRSRHALHRPFPLRIKLGDKVAVSRRGGREGEKIKGKGVGAKPRRKGGRRGGRKLRRTVAHVTAWMAEQLSSNIFFYVAACIVYSCKSSYKMFRALVTSL